MNYNDENLLEMVELYAENQCLIGSAEQLSEKFDENIDELQGLRYRYDQIALEQDFATFSDALCESGEIHPEQYDNYEYEGKYLVE